MKITFIKPNFYDTVSSDTMEPLVFAILKSLTPENIEVVLYDDRIESIPFDETTDLVALTVETYTAKRAYNIAMQYRDRGVPVVMGGFHPTFLPDEALNYADSVVIGDAEGLWETILEDCRKGKLKKKYQQTSLSSLNGIKPDRSIFANKKYSPISLVQFGRGCKYDCEFCSISAFYKNMPYRHRPIEDVLEEIESLMDRHIFIIDDNLFYKKETIKKLLIGLIPLKIRWSCQISLDVAFDDELMNLLEKSGCFNVLIGFETLSEENLIQMRKKWNRSRLDYNAAIKKFYEHNIAIYATFLFGYDQDTVDSFDATLDFTIRSKFILANFNPLTPMPGSKLFFRLNEENRLIYHRWWLHPDYQYGHALFYPKKMTPEQLTEGCFRARKKFNTFSSIMLRALNKKTHLKSFYHLKMYFLANLISKKEIYKKQDMRLG